MPPGRLRRLGCIRTRARAASGTSSERAATARRDVGDDAPRAR